MSIGIAILPLVILAVLMIGVIIYFICYKRRINRALEGKESGTHMPMASMETVVKVVVVIGVLVMYSSLSSKLTNLENSLMNTRNNLSLEIDVLNYEIEQLQEQLKTDASLISEFSYTFGEIDTNEHQVEVWFRVVPKSYSAETELFINIWGKEIALTNNEDGNFSGSEIFPVFEELSEGGVLHITEDGVTKTEVLEDVPTGILCYECMPMLIDAGISFQYEKGNGTVAVKGSVHVSTSTEKNVSMYEVLKLYVMRGNAVIDEIAMRDGYLVLDKEYEVKDGESLRFMIKGVDEYGYTHEDFLTGWSTEEESAAGYGYADETYQVYAPDGSAMLQ